MRKYLLLLITLFIYNINKSQNIQIPNGGFESWITNTYFNNPNGFYTSNNDIANPYDFNINRTTDKYQGNFAVKMQTQGKMENTLLGYLVFGFPLFKLGFNPYDGGFPYTDKPDSLTGYFKYNFSGNDSAVIFVIFKKNGLYLSYDIFKIYGSQNTFKKYNFKLSSLIDTPDSSIVGIMSGDPNIYPNQVGNWIIADNIGFVKGNITTLIPNGDFENWTPVGREEPSDWKDLNSCIPLTGIPYCTKTSDKHNGSLAVDITTTELEVNGSIRPVSFIINGNFIIDNLKAIKPIANGGFKVSSNPDSLSLYYKYDNSNNENDSAIVIVNFIKEGLDFGRTEVRLGPANIYSKVSFKLNIGSHFFPNGSIADTANIILSSSDFLNPDNIGIGNSLIIDDIKFIYNPIPTGHKISGTVTYDNNSAGTLTNNIKIYLKNSENIKIDSTFTDALGKYQFNSVANGTYTLEAKTIKKWRQCNTLDALKANRAFLGTYVITSDMRKKAGDVNNDNKVQPTDALNMNRRFIGTVSSFKRPDWIFENPSVTVNNADITVDFKGICAGDIGGAYTPPAN